MGDYFCRLYGGFDVIQVELGVEDFLGFENVENEGLENT